MIEVLSFREGRLRIFTKEKGGPEGCLVEFTDLVRTSSPTEKNKI